jgi:D-alanyl-D-alanine carboxypeptidase/D-alanyl-D-alanine-endopeptidase (penicillin-binding protein 4)
MYSCSPAKQIEKRAQKEVVNSYALATAHVGISIYEPATNKYWFNYGGNKYFIPASNTKIPTCYAAMKYLGDSLVGLRYEKNNVDFTTIVGTGDPTFLHPDFKNQPVFDFLKNAVNLSYLQDAFLSGFSPLGNGWAWNDYQEDYAAERSEMPIYGNVVKFYVQGDSVAVSPPAFYSYSFQWLNQTLRNGVGLWFKIVRPFEENSFHSLSSSLSYLSKSKFSSQLIPFKTISNPTFPYQNPTFIKLLEDTLHRKIGQSSSFDSRFIPRNILHSQPTDSLLKPMMHRSDNFFAEQSLLMVSNELLGVMNDAKIIDTLLKTDFKDLPQKPRWVDGSGLSRYNLFTPQDMIAILHKMKNEFGIERLKNILATGNDGTLSNYYKSDSNYIFAKTGTLSGVVALSGFLYTRKNKLLIFSVLVNNHQASAIEVRRAVEKFLHGVRENF